MPKQITETELLDDSREILLEKKTASKNMNMILSETAKMQKIEKPILARMKDYLHYKGLGWIGNDPLELNPEEKFKDRVSPTFKKLLQMADDLRATDCLEWLDPYLNAIKIHGIDIRISPTNVRIQDKDEVVAAVQNASDFQGIICNLADEINEVKAVEAEEMNLTKQNEFKKLLNFYDKKQNNKDIDDLYQNTITDFELRETGYTKIYDESLT